MFKSRVAGSSLVPASQRPEHALKEALLSIVQLWLDRLQQQAVVTTFFVSIDSLLLSLTSTTRSNWSQRNLVINASLGGAVIFHVCASILAYVASFILIRYRLHDAETLEETASRTPPFTEPRTSFSARNTGSEGLYANGPHTISSTTTTFPIEPVAGFAIQSFPDLRSLVGIYRAHPLKWLLCCDLRSHCLEAKRDQEASRTDAAVAKLQSLVGVLSRAHTVCAGMSLLGFVLALLGILTYAWTDVPTSLGIFASGCMGICGIAATIALWGE